MDRTAEHRIIWKSPLGPWKRFAFMIAIISVTASSNLVMGQSGDRKASDRTPPYRGSGYYGGEPLEPDAAGRILEFDSQGMILHGWLSLDDLPGASTSANDIWGYVSPAGREYAFIGLGQGVAFVDITEPDVPTVVGFNGRGCSIWGDIATLGEFAYSVMDFQCTAGSTTGVRIHDLSQIDTGQVDFVREVFAVLSPAGGLTSLQHAHNLTICEESGFLYLVGTNLFGGGLTILDLNDVPTSPTLAGGWSEGGIHDLVVHLYDDGPLAGREIVFAAAEDEGLAIIDVTDKSNVFTVSRSIYPNIAFAHYCWLDEKQKYLFLGDELDELATINLPTTTYIFDVEDIENPVFVRSLTNGTFAIDHNMTGRNGQLYEANYTTGLRVFDISDINAIQEIAWLDTYPESDSQSFRGAWGVYADFPSGLIVVSDIQRGLFIMGVLPTEGPQVNAADPAGWKLY